MHRSCLAHAVIDLEADDRDRHLDAALGDLLGGLARVRRRAVVAAVGDQDHAAPPLRGAEVVRDGQQRRADRRPALAVEPVDGAAQRVLVQRPDRDGQLGVPAALGARDLADLRAVDPQPERRALRQPVDERRRRPAWPRPGASRRCPRPRSSTSTRRARSAPGCACRTSARGAAGANASASATPEASAPHHGPQASRLPAMSRTISESLSPIAWPGSVSSSAVMIAATTSRTPRYSAAVWPRARDETARDESRTRRSGTRPSYGARRGRRQGPGTQSAHGPKVPDTRRTRRFPGGSWALRERGRARSAAVAPSTVQSGLARLRCPVDRRP